MAGRRPRALGSLRHGGGGRRLDFTPFGVMRAAAAAASPLDRRRVFAFSLKFTEAGLRVLRRAVRVRDRTWRCSGSWLTLHRVFEVVCSFVARHY